MVALLRPPAIADIPVERKRGKRPLRFALYNSAIMVNHLRGDLMVAFEIVDDPARFCRIAPHSTVKTQPFLL